MKSINNILFNPGAYSNQIAITLLILRLTAGILMLTHGYGKLERLFGSDPIQFADPLGVGAPASLALTVFAEFVCSILLIFGLTTRVAAVPLLITMLIVTFVIHSSDGLGKQELPLLYSAIYIALAVLGAGKYSIDAMIFNKVKH
ncbi:putative oxidoreductase [Gelidibacter sediminis]|uniref:Putative oxidoreductase n=1 Tax=Gelidibacter sediminis TaxID=1608710 RepID=A0A4V3F6X5_9FLAO|nr:DoxX family protein [Gelidibacter sediminis]TDU34326.1 putative oxidoreductase [Gelidibacter sediminis]